jgi:hypothetical protein
MVSRVEIGTRRRKAGSELSQRGPPNAGRPAASRRCIVAGLKSGLTAHVCAESDTGSNTITFIFFGGLNGIDLLRRFRGVSRRWVVYDIGVTADIDAERLPAGICGWRSLGAGISAS